MAADIKNYGNYSLEMVPEHFPATLTELRKSGRESFLNSGFPTFKTERWRATNLKKVQETQFTPVEITDVTLKEPLEGIEIKDRLRVINGQVQSDINHFSSDHKGILATALSQSGYKFPSELIGSVESGEGTPFYQLNTALFTDALSISVDEASEITEPIQIQYHAVTPGKAAAVSNRTVIEVRSGAVLNLVQEFLSEGDESILSNPVTEIILHSGARLNHTILQDESLKSNHFHQIFVHQGEGSEYEAVNLSPGAELSRSEYQVFLEGEKAHTDVRGLFAGSGNRVHNGDVTIHHRAKNCTSNSLFKAIGGDSSHGIFRGLVHVTEDGAGTDARQSYNSLVLTDDARITTEPHLLIYNDDVACSHGATVGQLDEKQLFYLESRGLDPVAAKKILIQSFAADVVSSLKSELQEVLLERVHNEVAALQ